MTDKQKTLNEIRDELAAEYQMHIRASDDDHEPTFKNGFDAGVEEMKKRAQGLYDAYEKANKIWAETGHFPVVIVESAMETYRKSADK